MEEKIHVAVCLDKGYVMPTGVMMYSACVNNQDVDIDFHVLVDESVTETDQKDLKDSVCNFQGKSVLFYPVKSMKTFSFPLITKRLTQAAYYRLFLSEILPLSLNKVLYLDGDTIVRHSLLPLWDTALTNYAVGVIMDVSDGDIRIYNRLKYPYKKGYFNSGVLLINLGYWRENKVVENFVDYIKNYPERIIQEDQDVLNAVLQDMKFILPVKYNLQTGFLKMVSMFDYWEYEKEVKEAITDPTIVHFTEKDKPWIVNAHDAHPFSSTWFKYQNMTKWKGIRYEHRTKRQRIRNYVGDILRKVGVLPSLKKSYYIEIPPID